jgi:hypothetical protein
MKLQSIPFTVDSVLVNTTYSERVSPHRSLICSQIKYVYSEYMSLVNTFCCTDGLFTINEMDCIELNHERNKFSDSSTTVLPLRTRVEFLSTSFVTCNAVVKSHTNHKH